MLLYYVHDSLSFHYIPLEAYESLQHVCSCTNYQKAAVKSITVTYSLFVAIADFPFLFETLSSQLVFPEDLAETVAFWVEKPLKPHPNLKCSTGLPL